MEWCLWTRRPNADVATIWLHDDIRCCARGVCCALQRQVIVRRRTTAQALATTAPCEQCILRVWVASRQASQRRVRNRAATGCAGVRMLSVREAADGGRRQRLVRQRLRIRRADDRASHTMHAAAGSDVRVNLCMRVRSDARQRRVCNRAATGRAGVRVLGVGEIPDGRRRQRFVGQRLRRCQQGDLT